MVNELKLWLSMRHFTTSEYLQGIYMGQQQYQICNTDIRTNGLFEDLEECTIFASTLTRCRQTVEYIVNTYKHIHFSIKFSDNLIERGLGDFEGKQKVIIRQDKRYFKNEKFIIEKTPPNGESFVDFYSRVNDEVNAIRNEFINNNILVISHLQVLRMIRFCIVGFDLNEWHNINYSHGEVIKESYGKE